MTTKLKKDYRKLTMQEGIWTCENGKEDCRIADYCHVGVVWNLSDGYNSDSWNYAKTYKNIKGNIPKFICEDCYNNMKVGK